MGRLYIQLESELWFEIGITFREINSQMERIHRGTFVVGCCFETLRVLAKNFSKFPNMFHQLIILILFSVIQNSSMVSSNSTPNWLWQIKTIDSRLDSRAKESNSIDSGQVRSLIVKSLMKTLIAGLRPKESARSERHLKRNADSEVECNTVSHGNVQQRGKRK